MKTLTGRRRYRVLKSNFSAPKLVLQVEEREQGSVPDYGGGRVDSREYDRTIWRDARIEDLTVIDGGSV